MKSILLLFLFATTSIYSQINFQKGYFINKENQKVNCLIENKDWIKTPEIFRYKLTDNDKVLTAVLKDQQELRIFNTDLFYVKVKLNQDLKDKNGDIIKVKGDFVFFKVLLKGEGSLFEYGNDDTYFFYKLKNDELKFLPIPVKKSKTKDIIESKKFRSELFKNLKCDNFSVNTFRELNYMRYDLTKLFMDYNSCIDSDSEDYYSKRTRTIFSLKLTAGLNFHPSLSNNYNYSYDFSHSGGGVGFVLDDGSVDFDSQTNFAFGGELEVLLPINKNKWSVFISPNYQSISDLSGSKTINQYGVSYDYKIDISSISIIELPFGIRYYMNLRESLQIFTHLAVATNIIVSSEYSQELEEPGPTFPTELEDDNNKNYNIFFGAGVNFNKFTVGLNYYFVKNVRGDKPLNINSNGAISIYSSFVIF